MCLKRNDVNWHILSNNTGCSQLSMDLRGSSLVSTVMRPEPQTHFFDAGLTDSWPQITTCRASAREKCQHDAYRYSEELASGRNGQCEGWQACLSTAARAHTAQARRIAKKPARHEASKLAGCRSCWLAALLQHIKAHMI